MAKMRHLCKPDSTTMAEKTIVTQPCKVSPMHYFGRLLRTWLYRNWAWLALIVVLLVMLSVHNPLFIYVGLMVVFLIFPLILYYLWFVYALHPDCRASILTKQVELVERGITCRFEDDRTETIAWSRVTDVQHSSSDLIFYLSKYVFFILPCDSFESPDDLEYFLKKILEPDFRNRK